MFKIIIWEVDETVVDELGVDETAVDKNRVDEPGINPIRHHKSHCFARSVY